MSNKRNQSVFHKDGVKSFIYGIITYLVLSTIFSLIGIENIIIKVILVLVIAIVGDLLIKRYKK